MRYLVLVLPLMAQTSVPPSMLRESNPLDSPASQVRIYAGDANGRLFRVRPGAGLTLRSTADGWVLEAVAAAPVRLARRVLTRDSFGNYRSDGEIFRNGILMTEGVDFRRDAGAVIPLPVPWAADDLVVGLALEAVVAPAAALDTSGAPVLGRRN